ncbi:MAG: hypothetical protein A2X53_01025 [Candidatus Rokubacteria bacterium GWA2_70_23]|nr:MAG: hypothetical protein A2X53_01025 [Candidatus Rokubacteria bacterium GWA2_70_23]
MAPSGISAGIISTGFPDHGSLAWRNVGLERSRSAPSGERVGMYGAPSAPACSPTAMVRLE